MCKKLGPLYLFASIKLNVPTLFSEKQNKIIVVDKKGHLLNFQSAASKDKP